MKQLINTPMRLDKVVFLSTLQLVIPDIDNSDKIIAFGSGFLLRHRERLFFITADHNIHIADHDENNETGQRTRIDYTPQIITNIKCENELASIVLPVGGFYYYTGYGFSENLFHDIQVFYEAIDKITNNNVDINDKNLPIDIRIPDFLDWAISEMKEPLPVSLLSNMVIDNNNNTIVEEGTNKISFISTYVSEFNKDDTYIVGGTVHNEFKSSVSLNRINIVHDDIKFIRFKESYAILETPEVPDIDKWAGLSGAPILNDKGQLVGMLIRGPKTSPYLMAVPINIIIRNIDIIISNNL